MKKILIAGICMLFIAGASAQDLTKFHLYNPDEKAAPAIAESVKEAKKAGKHVLIQIGGNWCIWCYRFNDFVTTDASLDSMVKANYIVYHLNWSKENYNDALLKKYGFPQRFGFPVFLVLDGKGNLIHTQNSSYLEENKSYGKEKVMGFLKDWSPKALDPEQYKGQ
jgi:thioredoxin-related protein